MNFNNELLVQIFLVFLFKIGLEEIKFYCEEINIFGVIWLWIK